MYFILTFTLPYGMMCTKIIGEKMMKKIYLTLLAMASSTVLLADNYIDHYRVSPIQSGWHGGIHVEGNNLMQYQSGPIYGLETSVLGSYGLEDGWSLYGKVSTNRSWSSMPYLQANEYNIIQGNHTGNNLLSFSPQLGARYQMNPKLLVGMEVGYNNSAISPGEDGATQRAVGYDISPYFQYTWGKESFKGTYHYKTLWSNAAKARYELVNSETYTGNGVLHNFDGSYAYTVSPNVEVGFNGVYQITNIPYEVAAAVPYINSNNLSALTGLENYVSFIPGVKYRPGQVPGLTLGLSAGMAWFDLINHYSLDNNNVIDNSSYMATLLVQPSVNYDAVLSDHVIWNFNASYTGVKSVIAADEANNLAWHTVNHSMVFGSGFKYNF